MFKILDVYRPYRHWLLRILLFTVFLIHGMGNLLHLSAFASAVHMPEFFALLLALAEVLGACLILGGGHFSGPYTRIGGVLLVIVSFIIMFTVHLGEWTLTLKSSHVGNSMEYMLILFLITLYMLLRGNKA